LHTVDAHPPTGKTTISELVRQPVQERYLGSQDDRRKAMQAMVGIRKAGFSFFEVTRPAKAARNVLKNSILSRDRNGERLAGHSTVP
jgi:hypothetical protein